MKPITRIASVLFGLGALIHIVRLFYPFRIEIGGNAIPYSASFAAIAVAAILSVGLWKESNK